MLYASKSIRKIYIACIFLIPCGIIEIYIGTKSGNGFDEDP